MHKNAVIHSIPNDRRITAYFLRPYQPNRRNRHIPNGNKQLPYQDKTADQRADCDIETAHCNPCPQIAKEHRQQEHKSYAKGDPTQHKQIHIVDCLILHGKLKEQVVKNDCKQYREYALFRKG